MGKKKTEKTMDDSNPDIKEVTRNIKPAVACMLWGRAGGRCQFPGCNRLLYRSLITSDEVNVAQKAHIYAFSERGPRGNEKIDDERLNSVDNLMLVCHESHNEIDQKDGPIKYPAEFLLKQKQDHEQRIEIVTGIDPSRKSHVLIYGASIGSNTPTASYLDAAQAMLPSRYPAERPPIQLGMVNMALNERDDAFWTAEQNNLKKLFDQKVRDHVRTKDITHLSVFALAPQPLLILLGTMLSDITPADVYQRHREPPTWAWPADGKPTEINVTEPSTTSGPPALVLGLSATVNSERITKVLGKDASIWNMSVPTPHNDILKSKETLSSLRFKLRGLLDRIKAIHGEGCSLHIFPAAPAAANVELGRIRMPKADTEWILYDQVGQHGFIKALTIARGD